MEIEETLQEIIKLLTQSIKDRGEQVATLHQLIEKSEKRIDRVNDMVNNLVSIMGDVTTKYTHHIDSASNCRDKVVEQNAQLIAMVQKLRADLEKSEGRYDILLSRFEQLAIRKGNGTQVNVK